MENKKGAAYTNSPVVTHGNEGPLSEAIPKHQHNTAPQHLRLLQYGLKIQNHQHQQLSQAHQHQKLNASNVHPHVHQHQQTPTYQQAQNRPHLQTPPQHPQQQCSYNPTNIPVTHQHFQPNTIQHLHQHQQKIQTQLTYQTHQHDNPLNQHNPQIWVPHQPPFHYHQQQQQQQQQHNKAEPQQQKQTNQSIQQQTKKDVVERKKSNNNQNLRSPSAKRPLEAPVTMQGWLHKQGSEGLMLWKKRWFVLSEYCLFYYKGPEEEKLLGSILLPSYKVSICTPEDKVNKKFAFKCEHANMRTYILAADSQELMMQWVRVLNLACLLQTHSDSDHQSGQSAMSVYNQSTENSDSGFHQQYNNQRQNYRTTPVHLHSSSNTTDLSNPSQQELSQYSQPLYANAPPKPRRLNDGGYSSPSPDVLDRNISKSPVNLYGTMNNTTSPHPEYPTPPPHLIHQHQPRPDYISIAPVAYNVPLNAERRTPDTYGRSKLNTLKSRPPTDYEDVYADNTMYKRPLSPISYTNKKNTPTVTPLQRTYTPVSMLGPRDIQYAQPQMRKSPVSIPRPHSADFLEYEVNQRQTNIAANRQQQPRPKSSLDINRTSSDNYFYTEERYAEKMRKSAQYLQKMPTYNQNESLIQPKRAIQKKYLEPENTFPMTKSNVQPVTNYNKSPLNEPVRSRSVLSEGSLSKELDMDLRSSPLERLERDAISPGFVSRQEMYGYNDPFIRSASARLAQNVGPEYFHEARSMNREGERKREESMKRLLEWKQRMLQSPLNRKVNQSNKVQLGGYNRNHDIGGYQKYSPDPYSDGRRSANPLPQYNSYSSDDEENEDRSKENVQTQAGRTLDTFPSVSESVTPALSFSTTAFNNNLTVLDTFDKTDDLHDANDKDTDNAVADATFTKPLKELNKESSHLAYVSNLRSEFSEKFEQSPAVTEIKSNGALVKSILAEFEKKGEAVTKSRESNSNTPVNDFERIIEENYMTMTPKKNILAPHYSTTENEENAYVEMTQGVDSTFLGQNNEIGINSGEQQPYEIICFGDGRIEPVYMELAQLEKNNEERNDVFVNAINDESKNELPDILIPSQNKTEKSNKSDSSDADDEASKDLDSLDAPSHPRFSLSDNFRPASYYLGASQTVPEFQDSSDSELVSPPPIPTSPPPLDDLDDSISSTQDISLTEDKKFKQTNNVNVKYSKSSTKKGYLSANLLRDQDSSSLNSINTDPDRRYSSRLSHNSDSDVELRMPLARGTNYERMLKRRPVSEEFCDELESLGSHNETIDSVDLDKYLQELQIIGNVSKNSEKKTFHDYENLCVMNNSEKDDKISTSLGMSHVHSRDNSRDTVMSCNTSNISSERRSTLSQDDFTQRARPESSASTTAAEIAGILPSSNCSTPSIRIGSSMSAQEITTVPMYFSDRKLKTFTSELSFNQPAPYYYSDLSMNTLHNDSSSTILTLNNQRGALNSGKKDITHIINPIRCNSHLRHSSGQSSLKNNFKLAAEARSVSVDFLNLTDKSGQIDKKNIYESDTLKRLKIMDSVSSLQSNPEMRNLYPRCSNEKFNTSELNGNESNVRRSHSLEGLLENVLGESVDNNRQGEVTQKETSEPRNFDAEEGSYLWEEDSIWHERLRNASQRHTKSLDDLDCIGEPKKNNKKQSRAITRGVTYVNDNIYNMPLQDKQQRADKNISKESFVIDREKLRQWDLLSSAPSDVQSSVQKEVKEPRVDNTVVEFGEGAEKTTAQDPASGSISLNMHDTFPRTVSAKRIWTPNSQPIHSRSVSNLTRSHDSDYHLNTRMPPQGYYMNHCPSQHDLNTERKANWQWEGRINVSAGELLGRTHEELVLLLIQLRRQSTNTYHAIEACYNEIDSIQSQLHLMDQAKRMENLQKLEQIKQHLLELEKQYEKGKPLVNLVDNMVKLGSLYRTPNDRNNLNPYIRDRLEFNQQIQERRLLAEEKRDWNRLNPNHTQLQEKVQQLYQLDHLIHEESGTLQGLQQDKEDIERALGGLRHRLNKGFNDPAEIEQARKQQAILENELSRVHLMLAQNSKKLEETVAGNARLEQELLVLKQKLQISRQQRSSPQFSNAGDSLPCVVGTSAMLESDLQRVQQKVGDLQRQRHELSMQVRQLTDKSNNLQQQIKPHNSISNTQSNKKKMHSLWRETDLDTMSIVDHGDTWENPLNSTPTTPLFINTDIKHSSDTDYYNKGLKSSDSASDDTTQNSNFTPSEKQEIKTVRIVKRESERRQRDREKTATGKWDTLLEEDDSSQSSSVLFRPAPVQKTQSSSNLGMISPNYIDTDKTSSGILSRQSSLSSPSLPQVYSDVRVTPSTDVSLDKSPELSPIFKSEAARQIITEMSIQDTPKQVNRRAIPKEKRRHYTTPHNNIIMKSLNQLPTDDDAFDKAILNTRRARDDLDMERALRQRIDAPDVVRSTLSNKELKYNENTIDNILGTPNKITIPERYIPEQLPQLSAEEQEHRLRKVESIKKMLSDTTIISSSSANLTLDDTSAEKTPNTITNKATTKMIEEKKQREHLLQLNQILAKQVMEMSKIVAVKALARLPLEAQQSTEEDDLSPITPLPLYQQRDNFYS